MKNNLRVRKEERPISSHKMGDSRKRGSVLVLVALSFVVLAGFAALTVDYGRSVVAKNQLQRACDAGALAGAEWLPKYPAIAKTAAVYWAYQNGKVVVNPNDIQIYNNNSRIYVPATRKVNFMFAPLMKILSGDVKTAATAAIQQRNGLLPPSVVPIGITPETYETHKAGNPVVIEGIRNNKQSLDLNEFVLFDLRQQNSKSPSHMQDQLQWGSTFNEVTNINDYETSLNAANNSQAKKFEDGMQSRFDAAAGNSYKDDGTKFTNIPGGSPRMMYFIVTPRNQAVNGNNNVRVLGFAPVYVTGMQVSGDTMRMTVRMLPTDYNAGGSYSDVSNPDGDATSFYQKRLVN